MNIQQSKNRSEICLATPQKMVRPRRTSSSPKPSEFRKLPKVEQDRIFREQAVLASEVYAVRPDLLISDSEPVHRY